MGIERYVACRNVARDMVEGVERDFPTEKFGVADKFLLSKVSIKQANIFANNDTEKKVRRSYAQCVAVWDEMKTFGYKTKHYDYII